MKAIRVGIIGQGRSGRDIHGQYLACAGRKYKITAVCDPMKDRRKRAAAEYGCPTYANYQGLLKRDDIDLIVNCGPSHMHVPLSQECLKAGFHVLCEKPLARRVAEVDKLIKASKEAGKVLAVFQNNRYARHFRQIKKVIDSGVLGRIVMIKVATNGFSRRWDWQTLRRNYGGSLLNTGSHIVDQVLQLFGTDIMPKVTCIMDRVNTYGDAEDHVKLILQAKGRPTVDLEISSCCAYPRDTYNIYGTRGGLVASSRRVKWKYLKHEEQPKRNLARMPISNAKGLPVYCSEHLKWHETIWTLPGSGKSLPALFYDMLYKTLTTGVPLEITMDHIRQQIAVIEECHWQNPPRRMPRADI